MILAPLISDRTLNHRWAFYRALVHLTHFPNLDIDLLETWSLMPIRMFTLNDFDDNGIWVDETVVRECLRVVSNLDSGDFWDARVAKLAIRLKSTLPTKNLGLSDETWTESMSSFMFRLWPPENIDNLARECCLTTTDIDYAKSVKVLSRIRQISL